MTSSIDTPTKQLFLSLIQVFPSFHLGHGQRKKETHHQRRSSRYTQLLIKYCYIVNKNEKQQGSLN